MKAALKTNLRLTVSLIALAAVAACPGGSKPPITPTKPVASLSPVLSPQDSLCSRADAQMALDRGLDSNAVNFATANGYYGWCIPEYDDDQRLADGGGGNGYGPVAHVLAAPWLDTLQITAAYRQVAIVEVDPDVNDHTPRPPPYNELGLSGQFGCLYLKLANGASGRFDALMASPSTGLKCPTAPTSADGKSLTVAVDDAGGPPGDYPATTRFVEANNGGRTLIGVKCGAGWCIVGPGGANGNAAPAAALSAHHAIGSLVASAQGRVKGWFDDQVLGIPDVTSPHKIHRQVQASAVPDPNLGNLHVADFIAASASHVYLTVGRVYFPLAPDPASKYVTVFGFSQGINTVAMRAVVQPATPTAPQTTAWFTRVTNANNVVTDVRTVRMDHSKYFAAVYGRLDAVGNVTANIPATMRWRWFDKDEDLWVECDVGCCLAGHQ